MREKLNQIEAVQQDRHHQLERKLTEETSLLTSTQKCNGGHLERLLDKLREEAEKATVTLATSAAVDVASVTVANLLLPLLSKPILLTADWNVPRTTEDATDCSAGLRTAHHTMFFSTVVVYSQRIRRRSSKLLTCRSQLKRCH